MTQDAPSACGRRGLFVVIESAAMPLLATWIVLLHVLSVFVLVAGILGRALTLRQVARAADIHPLKAQVQVASIFEHMVRHGSLVVLVTGLAAAGARGWPILGILQHSPINWVLVALVTYLTIIPWIVFILLPRSKVFEVRLAAAEKAGTITPELRASLADPVIAWARRYEFAMILFLTYLMVAKPF
jgi:hypothetical protein